MANDRTFRIPITLGEPSDPDTDTSRVQLLRAGKFKHPMWGTMDFNAALFSALTDNYHGGARGIEIAIDVDHDGGEAQGWFRDVMPAEDMSGLWADVEWTSAGRAKVADRLYRYMSVEYDPEYVDDQGTERGPTLLGAALTNRPFVKGMAPVMMAETEEAMDMADYVNIATALGLPDDADEAAILAAIAEMLKSADSDTDQDAAFAETQAQNIALTEQNRTLSERIARLERDRRETAIARLMEEGRLTPAMLDAAGGHLRQYAERDLDAFVTFCNALPVAVDLSERGSAGDGNTDPSMALDAAVRAAMQTGETYGDALTRIGKARPELVAAYREAQRNRV